MTKVTRVLCNSLLGAIVAILLIVTSPPVFSTSAPTTSLSTTDVPVFTPSSVTQPTTNEPGINQHLLADLQESEAVLMAQGASGGAIVRYAAILLTTSVVPMMPMTAATGVAGAALIGDRLVIRGDFGNLSSGLRDYATDPLNPPNPKITSAVHVHKGMPTENGPFQYALTVTVDATGLKGRFAGEYTLTSEQLQALADGTLYVDIHTKQNRAGELRGMFRQL